MRVSHPLAGSALRPLALSYHCDVRVAGTAVMITESISGLSIKAPLSICQSDDDHGRWPKIPPKIETLSEIAERQPN